MKNIVFEFFYWIHLVFVDPIGFLSKSALDFKKSLVCYLSFFLRVFVFGFGLMALFGLLNNFLGYSFEWDVIYIKFIKILLVSFFAGFLFGFFVGADFSYGSNFSYRASLLGKINLRLVCGFNIGFASLIAVLIIACLFYGLKNIFSNFNGINFWFFVFVNMVLGLFFGVINAWRRGAGSVFFIVIILFFWSVVNEDSSDLSGGYYFLLIIYSLFFGFFMMRVFYLPIHLWKYWSSRKNGKYFSYFSTSPIRFDSTISIPLPYLKKWLISIYREDKEKGVDEILFIIGRRRFYKNVAFDSLLEIVSDNLKDVGSISDLAYCAQSFQVFPAYDVDLSYGFQNIRWHINQVSLLAKDYEISRSYAGKIKILDELLKEAKAIGFNMGAFFEDGAGVFKELSAHWVRVIEDELFELQKKLVIESIPNPYIAGNPLQHLYDRNLFLGRDDILLAIEQYILNADQRPSLLLYGRRRTGKSSTLLNLPRSRFEPVYIDCQDAKWHESDQAFCYNLAHDLFNVLYQSDSVRGLRQPQIEQFDKNAFTQLDQFLTQAQKIAEQRSKRILLAFDEYEELENSIINGDISEKVLGKLRNLIQHSKSIVVLVSGSHRFEELTRLNWANYLINTRTLELSYLDAESARELLTKPVPELHYEAGVVDDIIRITHCQPYLLQAVASELVNYLNSKQQTTATPNDLNTALEKTLVSASAYFSDTWRKDNSATEQQVMRALATGKMESLLADAAFQPAIQSLIRKEIVEGKEDSYRLAVQLFARWIVKNQV